MVGSGGLRAAGTALHTTDNALGVSQQKQSQASKVLVVTVGPGVGDE